MTVSVIQILTSASIKIIRRNGYGEKRIYRGADESETIPVLNQLKSIADKHGADEYLRAYISSDKYMPLEGSGLRGWELYRFGNTSKENRWKNIEYLDEFDEDVLKEELKNE